MNSTKQKLSGVFAPVVTPFRNDKLQLDSLRENLRKLNETAMAGYLALGSNGEFKSLSDDEQLKVLEVFAEEKSDKVIMVGTACESTVNTIEKTKIAEDMGFDFASILTPNYFGKKMNDEALTGYYQRIADSVSIPVLLYNAPGFTGGVQISPKAVEKLARHENIVGMKDSSPTGPNRFLGQLAGSDNEFYVLAGSANFFYTALHIGASGGVLSQANVIPGPCCRLYSLFCEGAYDHARDLHIRIQRLNNAVSSAYGVPGVKAAMEIAGYKGGEPRHPLLPVTAEQKEEIRQRIIDEGFGDELRG